MSLLRPPWTSQPQQPVGIDWGNPITQGLEWYWTPIDSGPIVFNKPSNPVSAVRGVAQKFRTSVSDNIQGDRATLTPTAQGTVFALMISGPGTAAAGVVCRASGVGALGIRTGTGLVYAIAAAQAVGPSISLGANTLAFVAARNSPGNTGTIYCNGVFASAALTISSPSSAPSIGFTASGQNADHTVFLAGSFSRPLSDAEIASLGANPWQLFAPSQRRIWVPMAAASGGGVTGASGGTLQLAGSAAGSVLVSGASAGALAISGAAAASARVTGASTGALSISGTATGTVGATGVTGQSSQTLSLTGTSTGTVGISGQSAQALALSGTAAGSVRVSGASAGTLSLTGTAAGTTTGSVTGASSATLSLAGSATGAIRVSGGSAAVLQITGNAGAQIEVRGASAGVLLMTGSATGVIAPPPVIGISTGVLIMSGLSRLVIGDATDAPTYGYSVVYPRLDRSVRYPLVKRIVRM